MSAARTPRQRPRQRAMDVPKSQRPHRKRMTLPRLISGIVGAAVGIPVGYFGGILLTWALYGRKPQGILPPPTLTEALVKPGDLALYTPLTILLAFIVGGLVGDAIGRQIVRRRARARSLAEGAAGQ